jgi:hypothetical protein
MASPKSKPWWVLWVCVCPWLIYAPKCSNYALTNLLFGLCRFVWVSEVLVNLPSLILELQHAPLPPKCYKPRNVPQLLLLLLFSPLDSKLTPSSLGVCHLVWRTLSWFEALGQLNYRIESRLINRTLAWSTFQNAKKYHGYFQTLYISCPKF